MDHGLSGGAALLVRRAAKTAAMATLWIGLAAALAVATTWPAALLLADHALTDLNHPDLQCALWWGPTVARWVTGEGELFLHPDLLWPDGQDTRFFLWNFASWLVLSPIYIWLSPLLATNVAALVCMVLNGLAAAWAGRVVTGDRLGALAGLVVGSTNAYAFSEVATGRLDQALWAPMALFMGGMVLLWRQPERWRARVICGVGLGLTGAVYWFYAYFLVVLLMLLAGTALASRRLPLYRVRDLAAVGAIALLVAFPFLVPLLLKLAEGGEMIRVAVSEQQDPFFHQARFAVPALWGHLGALGPDLPIPGTRLPLLGLPLCLLAAWRGRGAVRWIGAMGALASVFAAGPLLLGAQGRPLTVGQYAVWAPMALLDALPGFLRFWYPYRWQAVISAALAVTLPWLLSGLKWQRLALAVVSLWLLFEGSVLVRHGAGDPFMQPVTVPPFFNAVASMGGKRPMLHLPFHVPGGTPVGFTAWHRQPIDGGLGPWFYGHKGHQRRRETVLLWRTMAAALKGEPTRAPVRWTASQAGGFHYVLLFNRFFRHQEVEQKVGQVSAVLGPPLTRTEMMTAWVVPGVGQAPPMAPGTAKERAAPPARRP